MSIRERVNQINHQARQPGILKKMLAIYLLCTVVPTLAMIAYNYFSTSSIMMNQSYAEMRQSLNQTRNSLNMILDPYWEIVENLKNDKQLNKYLSMDYRDYSYTDLAYYMKQNIDPIVSSHSYIEGIHFYTNNSSLPLENYHFFDLASLEFDTKFKLQRYDDQVLITMHRGKDHIWRMIFISEMDYYRSNNIRNYVEVELDFALIEDQFSLENESHTLELTDYWGQILTSSRSGRRGYQITMSISDFRTLENDSIFLLNASDETKEICMKIQTEMGLYLLMQIDKDEIESQVRKAPLRMSFVFFLTSILLFGIVLVISSSLNRRIYKILNVLNKTGTGDFGERLVPGPDDEFGQIEHAVNSMNGQIEELIRDNYEKQLIAKTSELNLLQEQINPHFLYNALGVISSLAMREKSQNTAQSIRYLANFYRISLNKGRKKIHVYEEIDLLRNYMQIQLLRFSDFVTIEYEVEEEVKDYMTIKLLLQPLVENSIHHARDEDRQLNILVKAYMGDQRICFDVIDNGVGIPDEQLLVLQTQLSDVKESFGLKNVDKRIRLSYGNAYGVSIRSEMDKGTTIHLEIPLETEEEAEDGRTE